MTILYSIIFSFLNFGKSDLPITQYLQIADSTKVEIVDFEGLKPIFEDKSDQVYIINFWATWCKPCVKELPYFEQIHDEYKNEEVKVILVSLDFPKQIESKLIPFLEKHQLKSNVVVLDDSNSNVWINAVDPSWTGAIPATVVYKADKRQFFEKNFVSFEELNNIIKSYLN